MKLASWNVNSLKVRLPQVLSWLAAQQPDVLALQETKTTDEAFPRADIEAAGYQVAYTGQKTYNGVALLSKAPLEDVLTDIPTLSGEQRRLIGATANGIRVLNLYVVNGQEVGSDKFAYKLHWLEQICQQVRAELERHERLAVVGDFNIAPEDRDVYDPAAWRERILCSTPERDALRRLLALGLVDTFRQFEQEAGSFSWWDYRAGAFRRNLGLRIDLILASTELSQCCTRSAIDREPRRQQRPSDHAPVVAEFAL
jgi:exodeoxyribonuclease-3